MVTLDKIYHGAYVLKKVVRHTDLIFAPELCEYKDIWLKTENLQVTGSFKLRGAYYRISQLSKEERDKGIIACSAGNHAQGVALAAKKSGISAVICIPDSAPISKIEATKSYGAEVVLVPGTYDDAYERALEIQKEEGRTFIHPFDNDDIIAGQGTIGLEILDQIPDVDAVVVPIGGGGLISGIGYVVKSLNPKCKVYGVQACNSPSMIRSLEENKLVTLETSFTFADGIAVKRPGDITFSLVEKYVDKVVSVTEDEIAGAVLRLMEKKKLVTEGAGAVAVAAVMHNKIDLEGKKTVCLLSGGNIDVNILSRVITRGLVNSGRNSNLTIALIDKPGQLEGIAHVIAGLGGNVVSVQYDRSDPSMAINSCFITVGLETRDHEHLSLIKGALSDAGFEIVGSSNSGGDCKIGV